MLLAAWAAFGIVRLHQPMPPAPPLNVVLVQGNIAEGQKWDRALRRSGSSSATCDLTAEGMARRRRRPAVVVWPETASRLSWLRRTAARRYIERGGRGRPGADRRMRFDERQPAAQQPVRADGWRRRRGDLRQMAPGAVRRIPADWFPLPIQVVPGGGFAPGPGPRTLHVPGLPPVGPLICYEAIFPGQVVDRQ